MNLTDIIQMQKDRSNGVVLSQISIDKLIGHSLMREIESERLTQALADKDLALMEQTEIAQAANRQAEETRASATIVGYAKASDIEKLAQHHNGFAVFLSLTPRPNWIALAAPQQHAQAALSNEQIDAVWDALPGLTIIADKPQDQWNRLLRHEFARAILTTLQPALVASTPAVAVPESSVRTENPPEFYKYNPDGLEGAGSRADLWAYGQLVGWRTGLAKRAASQPERPAYDWCPECHARESTEQVDSERDAALELRNVDEVMRHSDQSVRIRFKSARAASQFERTIRDAAMAAQQGVKP